MPSCMTGCWIIAGSSISNLTLPRPSTAARNNACKHTPSIDRVTYQYDQGGKTAVRITCH